MTDSGNDSSSPDEDAKPRLPGWVRGGVISVAGVLIGAAALALFCIALGVNLRDEGWSEGQSVDRLMLIVSLVGFGIATLLFWIGFILATHAKD